MMEESDTLDKQLLNRISENPGLCVRAVIEPFLLERSETALRQRIRALQLKQFIKLQKTKKEVLCYPVEVIE